MPIAFFTRTRTGALVSRLNNDVLGAQSAITTTLAAVLTNVIQLILALAVMIGLAWQVTAARAGAAADLRAARPADGPHGSPTCAGRTADLNAAMSIQMTERFSAPGATLVKLFGRPDVEAAEFGERARRVRDIGVRTAMVSRVFVAALSLVSALAQALVYGLGGYLAVTGQIEPGTVVTLALLLTRLYTPMTALANARVDVMTALVSFERVFEVLDLQPMITERPDARDAARRAARRCGCAMCASATRPRSKVSLASLEDVAVLDTRGGDEVLHGVDLEVGAGQLVALVGSSGAGKSTHRRAGAAALRRRLGRGRAGRDRRARADASPRSAARSAWSPRTGTCSTTRSGPTCATPPRTATDEEIVDALRRARLGELLDALPDGLDTVVGERGYRLSGGERQRLTIARLLLARPRVVILDEATAHLDSESEAAVQAALAEALAGRTAIVIAHRLSTVRAADLIAVVEHGPDRRARDPRRAARRGRALRGAVPHPVRRRERRRPRRRRGRVRRGRLRQLAPGRAGRLTRTAPSTRSSTASRVRTSSRSGAPVASRESSPSSTSSR